MRRTVLLLASVGLAVLLASGVALAVEKLDQENADPIRWNYRQVFNSHDTHLSQTFTAGKSGELSKVSVLIQKSTCASSSLDSLYKDIRVWVGHAGTTSPVGYSTTIPASHVPYDGNCSYPFSAPSWTEITFDPGNRPRVQAGFLYRIALRPERAPAGSSDPPNYHWYYNGYAYPGGEAYSRTLSLSDGWRRIGVIDFLFRTYVDVPDTDGDGITNDVDRCPSEPGPQSNNGCPILPDTVRPTGTVKINSDARTTKSRTVTLRLQATDPSPGTGVDSMRIKNAGARWTGWLDYSKRKSWKLTKGTGKKTIFVQYRDGAGNVSATTKDSIKYRP